MEHLRHTETEEKIEKAAEDLELELPKGLPVPLKIIVLIIVVGGLSVIASTFSDIFGFAEIGFDLYLIRLLAGVSLLVAAYGLVKKKMWSIWVFGAFVAVSIFFNPVFSILPAGILAYIIYCREYLE